MATDLRYDTPGILTGLPGEMTAALDALPPTPVGIVQPVHSYVVQPDQAKALGLGADRLAEADLRPAASLFARLLELDAAPLTVERPPGQRVVGTCRHFAIMACALLRHRSIPSRLRCGFATYFQPGLALDHWIVEYHEPGQSGWTRLDPEVLDRDVIDNPTDLRPDQFLSGAEAWASYRRREIDADVFGVYGTQNFGPAEIRGNVVKDLAALNKVEMLPWDEWGQMSAAYEGNTGNEYDELLDRVAQAAVADDDARLCDLYRQPDLRVPDEMVR